MINDWKIIDDWLAKMPEEKRNKIKILTIQSEYSGPYRKIDDPRTIIIDTTELIK